MGLKNVFNLTRETSASFHESVPVERISNVFLKNATVSAEKSNMRPLKSKAVLLMRIKALFANGGCLRLRRQSRLCSKSNQWIPCRFYANMYLDIFYYQRCVTKCLKTIDCTYSPILQKTAAYPLPAARCL